MLKKILQKIFDYKTRTFIMLKNMQIVLNQVTLAIQRGSMYLVYDVDISACFITDKWNSELYFAFKIQSWGEYLF